MVLAALLIPALCQAEAYPNKPIHFVVPFAPGGNTDIAARLIANGLSQQIGQSILVENRAGAGGSIGTDFVAKALPDGYTVLIGHIGALTINPAIYAKLPYDTLKDFEPVGLSVAAAAVLVTTPNAGIGSIAELVAKAKADPEKLTYSTGGSGTAAHMATELFNHLAQIQTTHVPYKGAAPATAALLSGDVTFSFSGIAPSQSLVKAGKLIALGVTGRSPSPLLPGVPTMASQGLKDYEVEDWNGLLVPTGTPKGVIERLNAELVKFLSMPETKTRLAQAGFEGRPGTPDQFAAFMRSEMEKWGRAARIAKIKAD